MARKTSKIFQGFLETIAIIAYKQPVTGETLRIGGVVVSTNIMRQLLDRGWIKMVGVMPGRPSHKTTDNFLDYFGLTSINELPSASDFKEAINGDSSDQDSEKFREI